MLTFKNKEGEMKKILRKKEEVLLKECLKISVSETY